MRSTGKQIFEKYGGKPSDYEGKVCIVTGSSDGCGKQTVKVLAATPMTIVMAVRNPVKGEAARAEILQTHPKASLVVMKLDLASFESVKSFAGEFKSKFDRLDYLIENAGIGERKNNVTVDKWEEIFQTNHLGHYLLFRLLEDVMVKSAPSRVVLVSSLMHIFGGMDWPDASKNHKGFRSDNPDRIPGTQVAAYGDSKLANVLMARHIEKHYGATKGVTARALHPGGVASNIYPVPIRYVTNIVLMSVEEGCATTITAMLDSPSRGFRYFSPAMLWGEPSVKSISSLASSDEAADKLWKVSEEIVAKFL